MSVLNETEKLEQVSLTKSVMNAARYYLSGRRGLIVLAVVILGSGLALNWGWLVAVGVAPVLLALAPCAAMCALGLCMNKMGGGSCPGESGKGESTTTKA